MPVLFLKSFLEILKDMLLKYYHKYYMQSKTEIEFCYDLCLNVPPMLHVVIDGSFLEVAGSRVVQSRVIQHGTMLISRALGLRMWLSPALSCLDNKRGSTPLWFFPVYFSTFWWLCMPSLQSHLALEPVNYGLKYVYTVS